MKGIFDKWLLDVTRLDSGGFPCFCPYENERIVLGMNFIGDECPGDLIGIFHEEGQEKAEQWVKANPDWHTQYKKSPTLLDTGRNKKT